MEKEMVLNVFPTQNAESRLAIVMETSENGEKSLVLRQESFSEDVGWFVQSRVALQPDQIPGLKMTLSSSAAKELQSAPRAASGNAAILRFSDAVAG